VTGQSGDVRLEVNRWVFRCFIKVFRVLQCRTSGGKLFHTSGVEYVNARLPKFVCIVGFNKGTAEERVIAFALPESTLISKGRRMSMMTPILSNQLVNRPGFY